MKIILGSLISGKSFCFLEFAQTIETIVKSNTDIEFEWAVVDNSRKEGFERRIKDLSKRLKIKLIYEKDTGLQIREIGYDRMKLVNELYNKLLDIMPDGDYCFIVEDDIIFEDKRAVKKCLTIMEDPLVATVTANTLARWDRGRFGKPQTSNYDGTILKTRELKLTGVEQVSTSAMGFWFTRMKILRELGFELDVNTRKTTDGSWSENLINHGYKLMIDQSIHCKHFYEKEDGMVNHVSPTHNPEGIIGLPEEKTGYIEVERISRNGYDYIRTNQTGSPQFIRVKQKNGTNNK